MPNVALCYFAQDVSDYTPVDIGYAVAASMPSKFDFRMEKRTSSIILVICFYIAS